MNLVIFGPPGSGKGTQAEKIAKCYNLVSLSTGAILRQEINSKPPTPLGLQAKPYLDNGGLVPDELVVDILKKEMSKFPESTGFIFDGYPRTPRQAEALNTALAEVNQEIAATLVLEVDQKELITRLLKRGKNSGRSDDQSVTVIENRLNVYEKNTSPLIDYYRNLGKLKIVNGLGPIEEIYNRLKDEIDKLS